MFSQHNTMGLFDTVIIEKDVTLPEFPDDSDPHALDWQTKDIGHPFMRQFKITDDGRLLRHEKEKRKRTPTEREERAQEEGYETWDAWEKSDTALSPMKTDEYTVENEKWIDHNMHGSFEFHASTIDVDGYKDFFWSYEARFTDGTLDKIVFLGERGNKTPKSQR